MSKNDRKLISIVLIVIMLLSYMMPVVSNAETTGDNIEFKDETLKKQIAYRCDDNDDGEVSKDEIKKLEYAFISEDINDLTGLEYAINLKSVQYNYRKENNISLDIIKDLKKIEWLYINVNDKEVKELDLGFCDNLTGLSDLSIYAYSYNTEERVMDLSKVSKFSNLKYLYLSGLNLKNVSEIGKLSKLQTISCSKCTGLSDISFVNNNTKLKSVSFWGSDVQNIEPLKGRNLEYLELAETKVSVKDKADFIELKDYTAYIDENFRINSKIENIFVAKEWDFSSSNNDVLEICTNKYLNTYIHAKNLGEAEITITAKEDSSVVRKCNIKVQCIDANQAVGAEMGTTMINSETLLKANGELWKIYPKDKKMLKLDTDVKKYVYEMVYTENEEGVLRAIDYSITQKTDGTIKYVFNGETRPLTDAVDIYNNGYLRTDGTYLKIKEDGTWEEVTNGVEKLVGSYLVKADGTYTVTNTKICDFKIDLASYNCFVDSEGKVYKVQQIYSDNNNYSTQVTLIGENFKEFNPGQYSGYITTDGKVIKYDGTESENVIEYKYFNTTEDNDLYLNKSNEVYLNSKLILSNVASISIVGRDRAIFISTDGTLWCFTLGGEGTLEKFAEETGKTIHFTSETITAKRMLFGEYLEDVLTGFDINNLKIADVLGGNGLKPGYTAKVFDKDENEMGAEGNIFTGAIVKIYNEKGDVVASYVALVYGDVTGKGNPSATDALAIVKNKSGKVKIEDAIFLEAGRLTENSRKTGAIPDVNDALELVKRVLGK